MQAFLKSGKLDNTSTSKASTSTPTSTKPKLLPWVEKYRPRTVSDVVAQSEAVQVLEQCISGADLPNLLFYGPPGTGKTSTILAAARQLFGEMFRERILEMNASDERGIQVIRDKVKTFSQLTAGNTRPDGKPCPSFKIVILDEADSMTPAAQAALRRTIEKETRSTRFCLICNYVTRIIEPLTSRCSKFRFKPLNESLIFERLRFICDEENVQCDDNSLNTLVEAAGGDLRRAINCLQSCAKLKGSGVAISPESVLEVTGIVPDIWIKEFFDVCKTRDRYKVLEFVTVFSFEAYSTTQFLAQVHKVVIFSKEFNDKQKAVIAKNMAVIDYRLHGGASKYLQIAHLAFSIVKALLLTED